MTEVKVPWGRFAVFSTEYRSTGGKGSVPLLELSSEIPIQPFGNVNLLFIAGKAVHVNVNGYVS
jgi:hypothetical protein